MTVVELVCKAEDVVVARVEITGNLDAASMRRGLKDVDRVRLSSPKDQIVDGVQMVCGRCHEAIYMRGQDGQLFAAMPGSMRAQEERDG